MSLSEAEECLSAALVVRTFSLIKNRSSISSYRLRKVNVLFNYRSFTQFQGQLMFITHSVKSFDFGLWNSVPFALPLKESQFC